MVVFIFWMITTIQALLIIYLKSFSSMQTSHIIALQHTIQSEMKNQETEGPKSSLFLLNGLSENAYEQSIALVGSSFYQFQTQLQILNSKINFLKLQQEKSQFFAQKDSELPLSNNSIFLGRKTESIILTKPLK